MFARLRERGGWVLRWLWGIGRIYRWNRAQGQRMSEKSFAQILRIWNVASSDIERVIAQKRCEMGCGIVLMGLTLCSAWMHAFGSVFVWLALLSLFLLGLVMTTTSLWRIRCLRKRAFIPFWIWLCRKNSRG
ncbi:MAG: hypothetical protein IJS54_03555 [Desulfovibrio sp.]|nr:hypothetical protein [Desulfovibrio sp.]